MAKKMDICALLGIDVPILQAPMAGAGTPEMAAAISNAGGLGALGVALQSLDKTGSDVAAFRQKSNGGLNLNFFVHQPNGGVVNRPAHVLMFRNFLL